MRDMEANVATSLTLSSYLGMTFDPLECDTMEFCQGSEGFEGIVDGGKKHFGHHNRKQNKESCGSGRAAGRSSGQ